MDCDNLKRYATNLKPLAKITQQRVTAHNAKKRRYDRVINLLNLNRGINIIKKETTHGIRRKQRARYGRFKSSHINSHIKCQ